MSVAIGIDLGTTNTVVAAVKNGRAVTLADENGEKLLPSILSFHPSKTVLVGHPAIDRRLVDPENTVFSIKRLIGRNWSSQEVQQARTRFPFELVQGAKESVLVKARGETYALPEISAFVLRRAKAMAEKALNEEVTHAVITVPANFNDLQRASTKVAGKLAGLEVLRILNEPTAAALAYGQMMGRSERIAIYDLGGGTFDLTVLDLSGAVFEVLATGGDTALGGDDIDNLIADRIADAFMRTHRYDAHSNRESMARLRIAAEKLKRMLSDDTLATVTVEGVAVGEGGRNLQLDYTMEREELEELAGPLLGRTFDVALSTLKSAGLKESDIDKTILVGGATRMPIVPTLVQSFFRKPPSQKVNPEEVVALGAAMQAYALAAAKMRQSGHSFVDNSTPSMTLPRGIAQQVQSTNFGAPNMPPSSSTMTSASPVGAQSPVRQKAISASEIVVVNEPPPPPDMPEQISFRRSAPELTFDLQQPPPPPPPVPQRNPLTVPNDVPTVRNLGDVEMMPPAAGRPPPPPPAAGAPPAMARPSAPPAFGTAGPFGGGAPELGGSPFFRPIPQAQPLLIDVTPLNLNVETAGGYCDVLIEANSPIPCDRTRVFMTGSDNQEVVTIRVSQGPGRKFADNTYLGEVELSGLTRGPRGSVRIQITFEIDADGILNVKAKDEETGALATARLKLLGANTDQADVDAMAARQARMAVG